MQMSAKGYRSASTTGETGLQFSRLPLRTSKSWGWAAEMKLAMAEVYEVATFYHHFDVVKEGEAAPPALTVRVCDSIACDLAGSHRLLERLPALLGPAAVAVHDDREMCRYVRHTEVHDS